MLWSECDEFCSDMDRLKTTKGNESLKGSCRKPSVVEMSGVKRGYEPGENSKMRLFMGCLKYCYGLQNNYNSAWVAHCVCSCVISPSFMGALVCVESILHSRMWLKAQQYRVNPPFGLRAPGVSVPPAPYFDSNTQNKNIPILCPLITWPQTAYLNLNIMVGHHYRRRPKK